ncbi:MAG: alpha/beta-hydrolase family protein [Acidimicrobiia bacterium]
MAYRKRSALVAGAITGIRYAVKSFEPSLMPRSAIDQGLITGGSFLTGFLSGTLITRTVGAIPLVRSSGFIRVVGFGAAATRTAQALRNRLDAGESTHSPATAWAEAGGEVAGAAALAGLTKHNDVPLATVATTVAVGLATASDAQAALAGRTDSPDIKYIATALGVAFGSTAAVAALAGVIVAGGLVPRVFVKSTALRGLLGVAGSTATAVGIAAAVRLAGSRAIARIEAGNAHTEIAFANEPNLNTVSGSQYSLAPYATLGLQGRRLVSSVTSPEVISEVMGERPTAEPVRAYIGMETVESDEDPVELAIQELRRTGGFERSIILAASPAGTGYVNYITIEAAELMTLGDIATVAIQYGGLPSMLSAGRVKQASDLYAALIKRLRHEIDQLDRGIQLVAYGESLGALTSQNGVQMASRNGGLAVDAALWVGTPLGSSLFEELTGVQGLPVYDRFEQYEEDAAAGKRPTVTFLNHDNDPVTKFTPASAYRMPDWLMAADRGRGTNPNQRWLPGIAFWQDLIDTKNAATVVPGEFYSTGHDYRADLAGFVRAAYGFNDVTSDQMARIEQRLRTSEIDRAERISQGHVPTSK